MELELVFTLFGEPPFVSCFQYRVAAHKDPTSGTRSANGGARLEGQDAEDVRLEPFAD